MGDGNIESIRHLPDIFLGNAAVVRQHGLNAVLVHVGIELVHGGVQQLAEALGLEAAAEQHIAPVVAHAPLPALGIRELDDFPLLAAEHPIVVPVQQIPAVGVLGTVEVNIPALGIGVARQQLERQPVGNILGVKIPGKHFLIHGGRFIVEDVQHLNELGVVAVALDLHELLKGRLVIGRVRREADNIFISVELKGVDLVQLARGVQPVGFQGRFIQLLHLGVQAVVHKGTGIAVGEVLDIEVDELGPQSHHLVDSFNKVVGHFVAEAQALAHVLVESDGALAPPASLVLFELDLIVFLGVPAGGLAADLHRGVGGLYPIAQLPGQGAVLVAHLQKGVDLIAGHAHGRVIVGGVVVDLGPAVVGVLAVIAPAHGKVHGHHAAVVVNGVELRVVPQVDTVDILQRSLFHLVSCFIPRRCL